MSDETGRHQPSQSRGLTNKPPFFTSDNGRSVNFGVTKKHMPRYLDEFTYRFNRRWREGELFGFVLARAVRGRPLPYARLTAELFG
jgi:hypothetical protein